MKGKRITPFYYIFSIIMLAMACAALSYNFWLFCVEASVAVLTALIVFIQSRKYKKYVASVLNEAIDAMDGADRDFISRFPVAAAVLNKSDKLIWYNSEFEKLICAGKNMLDMHSSKLFGSFKVDTMVSNKISEIKINGKYFNILAASSNELNILYFFDNTKYIETKIEYENSRPAVAIVSFDNRYELERDYDDNQISSVVASVEACLQKWANANNAMFVKTSRNRYMLTFEERYVRKLIDEKFSILDEIHHIEYGENRRATISIGVGRGAESFTKCELLARKALEICNGRGGDQVAVTNGNGYQFFGGTSMGVETYDKVRVRVIASALAEKIKISDKVIIMGHKFSDLDCVGSAIGMWSIITKSLHIPAVIAINKKQSNAKMLIDEFSRLTADNMFTTTDAAQSMVTDKTLLIVVDAHSVNFVESKELYEMCQNVVVIDHHRITVDHIDNAVVFFHDPYASSASEMVTELVQYMGDNILSHAEAEALLSGIMLDTKNFVLRTGVRTFEAAAYLRKCGADSVEAKGYLSNSLDTYKDKSAMVASASIYNDCAITYTEKSIKDIRIIASQAADELLYIEGVNASFAIYVTDDTVNISARSLGKINVQLIMESFGGGGHHTMAAAQVKNSSIKAVIDKLHREIDALDARA